jgi:hypothetical protein
VSDKPYKLPQVFWTMQDPDRQIHRALPIGGLTFLRSAEVNYPGRQRVLGLDPWLVHLG